MASTAILIPVRYESKRFPGKPLTALGNMPMVSRVYRACVASGLPTFVLTDSHKVADAVPYEYVIWTRDAENGTARCCQAMGDPKLSPYTEFINVQGDMPDVDLDMIEKTKWHLKHYQITTLWAELEIGEIHDENKVKVITSADKALWFGRGFSYGHHHLGIYGFKRHILEKYNDLEVTREELNEGLEQLRWLKAGYDIGILKVPHRVREINTPEDARLWNASR